MAILRSDIERALDELIVHEEGMKFQALAVVLAKLRWEDLVASERKNDLGLDAYVSAATADDHVGKGLACSITPTLSKITSDAEEARRRPKPWRSSSDDCIRETPGFWTGRSLY